MGKLINTSNAMSDFENYGKCPIEGYIQTGDVTGIYYGHWFKQLDDGRYVNINYGTETKKFWVSIRNCYYGSYNMLGEAVNKVDELIGG